MADCSKETAGESYREASSIVATRDRIRGWDSWRQIYFCTVLPLPLGPPPSPIMVVACRLPTVPQRFIYFAVNVIMVQMAAAQRLFLAVCYFRSAMFNPDVHLPAVRKPKDLLLWPLSSKLSSLCRCRRSINVVLSP